MRFIRMILGSPFLFLGILLMLVGTAVMGVRTAGMLADEMKGFTSRKGL
jgi:hypothetical protein